MSSILHLNQIGNLLIPHICNFIFPGKEEYIMLHFVQPDAFVVSPVNYLFSTLLKALLL